ncbi:hypothetical protein SAMN05421538_10690 [Paracoccus isoporae]|uniref:Uncharacterized protein n=1 Tax=Paracoccus isoporae TaxID=591205 RepID=A0A1G7CIB3_9RHOB|nr:hypothetical protein [Paracoccus isoporae]SDE38426.1 hypothetical protein SAMN05421538_10690 [Paracoccus isoporae]
MGLIRPELAAWLAPRRELLAAVAVALIGGWLASRGGWFLFAIGAVVFAIGAAWAVTSFRRLAFRRDVAAPGLVEVVEGEIRYYAARALGGTIALRDLTEIRLIRLDGHDHWRLKSADGQALLIPVEAKGAEGLAAAFATLPGIEMGRVTAAMAQTDGPSLRVVWTGPAPG